MFNSKINKKWIWWTMFVFIVGCFLFIYIVFPFGADDWWYWGQIMYLGTDENGHHTLWNGIKECIAYHYSKDNARLCNTIGTFFILLPKWTWSVLCAIGFSIGLWMMSKLSIIKPGQVLKFAILSFLLIFGIMWQNQMFTLIFGFNYVLTLPIFLYCFFVFINYNTFPIGISTLIGFIIGIWHESYGVSFLASGIVILLCHKNKRCKWRVFMLFATFLGVLYLMSFSGLWNRVGYTGNKFGTGIQQIAYQFVSIISLIMAIICVFSKKTRFIIKSPIVIASITSFFVLLPITIVTAFPRASFPAIILSICSVVFILSKWFPSINFNNKLSHILFTCFIFLLIAVHLIAVCDETIKLRKANDDAIDAFFKNKGGYGGVFTNVRYPWDASPLTLSRPSQDLLLPNRGTPSRLCDVLERPRLMCIPSELKTYRYGEGRVISSDGSCRIWHGNIVSYDTSDSVFSYSYIYFNGFTDFCPTHKSKFTGADGRIYVYVVPIRSKIGNFFNKPDSIKFF